MVAAIAEVIKIMDRLGAGLANDIGEAGNLRASIGR
jgi:hypothetical protein